MLSPRLFRPLAGGTERFVELSVLRSLHLLAVALSSDGGDSRDDRASETGKLCGALFFNREKRGRKHYLFVCPPHRCFSLLSREESTAAILGFVIWTASSAVRFCMMTNDERDRVFIDAIIFFAT